MMRDINHVRADFTTDDSWWDDLKRKGFDPGQPSIFLVEGLTMHLTQDELIKLLKRVSELMCSSSILLGDYATDEYKNNLMWKKFIDKMAEAGAAWNWTSKNEKTFKSFLNTNSGLKVLHDFKTGPEGVGTFSNLRLSMNKLVGGGAIPEHRAFRAIKFDSRVKIVKTDGVDRGMLVGADGKIVPESPQN
jgi:hypothetical protein